MTKSLVSVINGSPLGLRVKSLRDFCGVPKGTEGIIDEVYDLGGHKGVMVAWDLPDRPLPHGYKLYDGRPAVESGLLRDGFGQDETEFLEIIEHKGDSHG